MTCIAASPGTTLEGVNYPSLPSSNVRQHQRSRPSFFSVKFAVPDFDYPYYNVGNSNLVFRRKCSIDHALSLTGRQDQRLSVLRHSITRSKRILRNSCALLKCETCVGISPFAFKGPFTEEHSSNDSIGSKFKPDECLEHCISEVLRNIQEAPFLQLVFESPVGRRTERQRVTRDLCFSKRDGETAGEDNSWEDLKDALAKLAPDGVILVQRLHPDMLMNDRVASSTESYVTSGYHVSAGDFESPPSDAANVTDVWGLLFLGETTARTACYLLETTRVSSSAGICTRFCLTRAQCFGPSVREQLERIWLVSA